MLEVGDKGGHWDPGGISFLAHYSRVCVDSQHQGNPSTPAGWKGACCGSLSPGPASIQLEHIFPQAHTQYNQGQTNTPAQRAVPILAPTRTWMVQPSSLPLSPPDQDRSLIVEYIHLPGNNTGLSSSWFQALILINIWPPRPQSLPADGTRIHEFLRHMVSRSSRWHSNLLSCLQVGVTWTFLTLTCTGLWSRVHKQRR